MLKRVGYPFLIIMLSCLAEWPLLNIFVSNDNITLLEMSLCAAGNNRSELEKVLRYYEKDPADSLKYRAACFLIENMPFYVYADSEQLENYKSYYHWLKKSFGKTPQQVADSVKKVFGPLGSVMKKKDILEVDSAYLCQNIEWAFKVWKEQPWGKNISFETFCEYILPYRIEDEPLEYWREEYYNKYSPILDSLLRSETLDKEDPVVVANYLIEHLPDNEYYYTSVTPYSFGHIGPKHVQYVSGSCREVTDFGLYLFRALGIPCAIDFIPVRSYVNAEHFWLVVWDKNNGEYVSDFPEKLGTVSRNRWYKYDDSSKVYRYTFSVNRRLFEEMAAFGETLYPFWRLPKFKDVTRTYSFYYKKELLIPVNRQYKDRRESKIAYLCLSQRNKWIPIDWTEYKPDNLLFKNLRKGAVLRVATYEAGELHFLTDPFYIDRWTNEVCFYSIGDEKQDVVLYAKTDIAKEWSFRKRMVGGVFEGSNQPDFSEKDTLYIIQHIPYRLFTTVHCEAKKEYRYYRYVGAAGSNCNVSEIAFFEVGDTLALNGRPMGTPGCYQRDGSHEYPNVYDGKTWTSFDYSEPDGGWAGIDIGRKVMIDIITYTPRNRDNYVRPGDLFELFYCDGEWKSAGMKRAQSDSIVYKDIPENALLYLRNHSRGVDERIFVYENGIQLWR